MLVRASGRAVERLKWKKLPVTRLGGRGGWETRETQEKKASNPDLGKESKADVSSDCSLGDRRHARLCYSCEVGLSVLRAEVQ